MKVVICGAGQRAELSEDEAGEQQKYGVQRHARTPVKTVKHGGYVGFQR